MAAVPPYFATLTHPTWEEARAAAQRLPPEAMAEVRLDLYPDEDPELMIRGLGRKCLITCRRIEEGGAWTGTEADRLDLLVQAAGSRPAWLDLEWDVPVPDALVQARAHLRLLRSVHVAEGVFDLEDRLEHLPTGDAYVWVGRAGRLADNARLRAPLAWARDRELSLCAFLLGPKGFAGRCLQFAWGGAFTYAACDDAPVGAPGQIPLGRMLSWRCHRLHAGHALCGVLGHPILHSRGPAFHNPRFQAAFKDLLYLPLECGDAHEALEALEALGVLGASLTSPLKETLPPLLGLPGPFNTLYRRNPAEPWSWANTDDTALDRALESLPGGPVLVLGDGGVAATTRAVLERRGWPVLQASRKRPCSVDQVAAFAPVGIIQATSLGMAVGDLAPSPELMEAALPGCRWAVEWIYKEDTVFAAWARAAGLTLVEGAGLFEGQAQAQSELFIRCCGGG